MTEAEKIYGCIFGRQVPSYLEDQFHGAPSHIFPPVTDDMRAAYDRILAEVRDLEALEFASRIRRRNLLLTLKFQLMVHLAECHPESRTAYINLEDHGLVSSLFLCAGHGIRCVYKLLKGSLLLRRYDGP